MAGAGRQAATRWKGRAGRGLRFDPGRLAGGHTMAHEASRRPDQNLRMAQKRSPTGVVEPEFNPADALDLRG